MKRKIILSLLAVLLFSALGAGLATLYLRNTTTSLNRLINLHEIENLRQRLIISIQTVQSDLLTVHTTLGRRPDLIAENVAILEQAAAKCASCHHTPVVTRQINEIQSLIKDYQSSIGFYLSTAASAGQSKRLERAAAGIGNKLLVKTEDMSAKASSRIEAMTQDAMKKVKKAWIVLITSMLLAFLFAIIVAMRLIRAITTPINTLLGATRMIASGDLGYTIHYRDTTEFGLLASNFNSMSKSLEHGYAMLHEEICERTRAQRALVKSEAFLTTVFDSIRDPFCIIDREYRIVRANVPYAEMKRIPLSGLIGKTCYATLRHRDTICEECIVQATFASGDPCGKEKPEIMPDGTKIWQAIYTYPIADSEGNRSHVIEYTHDITERKRAEDTLRESEERYALAARGANDGLYDWDLRNNRIYYSLRWMSMLGFGEKEFSNHPHEWFSRVHPDERAELEARIAAHCGDRNPHFECEFRIMNKDGTYRWVMNRGLVVKNSAGQAYRIAGSQTDITSKKTSEEQLLFDVFHDALTGLPNRALLMDRIRHLIAISQRRHDVLYALLFLDMDRFKIINDSLGHLVGDQLLILFGRKLTECLRPGDTIARFGGDEFAVLLENISELQDAVDVADRIHGALKTPFVINGHEIYAAVSIGIALGSERYERPEHVLRDADIAMYQAKGRRSACSEIFDIKMHANILDRIQLEADLHGAVDQKELSLVYQPIMDLKTRRLTGFEALVRWNHATRGMIFPLEFISLAEENGLINSIGDWILREACRELRVLQDRYPSQTPLKMSINISGKQFAQEDLADRMAAIIKETGIDARSLAIEITETMIMRNIELAVVTMDRLRAMGVHIHIDDFGTGYSSLSYLHRFPIDALKIDRSFVNMLSANGDNQEVIQSIVSLAKSLNFDVIAEGVELEHQLSSISELQCGFGQGYLFSVPMAPGEIDAWVQTEKVTV